LGGCHSRAGGEEGRGARAGRGGQGQPRGPPKPVPRLPRRAAGWFLPIQFPHSLIFFTCFHLPIKTSPNCQKALFACRGPGSKMLTYCLLAELNISLFSSHLKEVLEQYSKTVQTNKTCPFARERNPVYSIRGHILRSLQIWF